MKYILDTNVLSDVMNERATIIARLDGVSSQDRVATSAVVRGELLFGARRIPAGRRREELIAKADEVPSRIPCESISADVADHYADIKLARRRAGLTLDENDLWIAATARALGAVLITRDRDFQGIEGLATEDWSS